ncbi:MAG: STAS domain-containing protein [Selenomonadaceae bacterium]|nr:STAS domain-containing protein [Selenomonadaceae bacterium]
MSSKVEFQTSTHKDWQIFSIIGRVDTVTAAEVDKVGNEFLQSNNNIALDMSAMDYISSAGLRVLLRIAKKSKRDKKKFVLFGASGMIKEVLEASGMDMLVTIYETQEDLP